MRIRQGFVSNSSSSSFVCGADVTIAQARSLMTSIIEFDRKYAYTDIENEVVDFDVYFQPPFIADAAYVKFLKDYFDGCTDCYEDTIKHARGRVIIASAEDNSIPYAWFDVICSKLDATRLHLG